jgi:hypothetical protein
MQGETVTKKFSEDYINTCFTVWYSLGQPVNMSLVIDKIPESPDGNKPTKLTLSKFKMDYGWVERADVLNAKAVEIVEHQMVDQKAVLLKKQMEDALAVNEVAKNYILDNGFDSSASAVNAFFKSAEEVRTVVGVSAMLTKISKMSEEELRARAEKLLQRKNSVEGEIMAEEDDSEATSQ